MDEYTGFTKLLFGDKNVLGKKQFVNQMVSFKCNWALNPSKIRERIELTWKICILIICPWYWFTSLGGFVIFMSVCLFACLHFSDSIVKGLSSQSKHSVWITNQSEDSIWPIRAHYET